MHRGNIWGGPLDVKSTRSSDANDRETRSHGSDIDPSAYKSTSSHPATESDESFLLAWWRMRGKDDKRRGKHVDLGFFVVSRNALFWTIGLVAGFAVVGVLFKIILNNFSFHRSVTPVDDAYAVALRKALLFFDAQMSGELPKDNSVPWRGNSGMKDGLSDNKIHKDLVGGFYDAGDAIKFNFPASFSMTILSWSVIEYGNKYKAAGQLKHVMEIIKWGTDYILKTFDSSAETIYKIVAQVGVGNTANKTPNDHYCWMRPEDMDYPRPVSICYACSDLAAEMAAALAAASIVFRHDANYSKLLTHGAEKLWHFARNRQGRYSTDVDAMYYNSTGYWDEFIWGGAWLYYATGNTTYLTMLADDLEFAKTAGIVWTIHDYRVFSWDSKLPGAHVLLTRLRIFLSPGYPYEQVLKTLHNLTEISMCSYLPIFSSFKRTKGGLILLNPGGSRPLQYVVNVAFLASLYSDYLEALSIPGWFCGPNFYVTDVLREFAKTQIDYILGRNPKNMSYVVGIGDRYPVHAHHRGASIPQDHIRYSCTEGWKWRDSKIPNPNLLVGAMVSGPDMYDKFKDVRAKRKYTEPTLAGNSGLAAALASLSGERSAFDMDSMFTFVVHHNLPPPPPAQWHP